VPKQIDSLSIDGNGQLSNTYSAEKQIELNKIFVEISHKLCYLKCDVLEFINLAFIFPCNFNAQEILRYLYLEEFKSRTGEDLFAKSWFYEEFARIFHRKGINHGAIENFSQAVELFKNVVDLNSLISTYKSLAWIYGHIGNRRQETIVSEKVTRLEDTLYQLKSSVLAASVSKLQVENKSIKENADKQLMFLSVVVVLLLSSLILTAILLFRYQKRLAFKRAFIKEKEREYKILADQARNSGNALHKLAKENSPEFLRFFRELYPEFCETLRSMDPKMSTETLKFCAYLKLNFTSKEIAQFTHREVRSIQTRKNRLRKQLSIPSEVDLNVFMAELTDR